MTESHRLEFVERELTEPTVPVPVVDAYTTPCSDSVSGSHIMPQWNGRMTDPRILDKRDGNVRPLDS